MFIPVRLLINLAVLFFFFLVLREQVIGGQDQVGRQQTLPL
ncbi:MAG: hypothetical protein ACI8V5_001513, partial [Limisphaerales bacterium]